MDIDVSAEIVIDRTRDDVATYVENPENEPVWIGGIVESKPLTDPPVGIGTRVQRVATFMGRRMRYTPEVVEYHRGRAASHEHRLPVPDDHQLPVRRRIRWRDCGPHSNSGRRSLVLQAGGAASRSGGQTQHYERPSAIEGAVGIRRRCGLVRASASAGIRAWSSCWPALRPLPPPLRGRSD